MPGSGATVIRVLVIAGATLVRVGIVKTLKRDGRFLTSCCSPARSLTRTMLGFLPDVVLLPCQLDDGTALALVKKVMSVRPQARVVVVSHNPQDEESFSIIGRIASVVSVNDQPRKLSQAVEEAYVGGASVTDDVPTSLDDLGAYSLDLSNNAKQVLSRRERDVLTYVAKGNTNNEIGKLLGIAEETVKYHVSNMLRKLHARDRAHAVAIGYFRVK